MDQKEFASLFSLRPQNYSWFLGAGSSRTSGLPTATDIIWDLKLRYYCREERQDISKQDIQNEAVKNKIQSYMTSKGFPNIWSPEEYSMYFEKIFGDDYERQKSYLQAILSEEKVTLTIGNRALAALMASDLTRLVFTTNFDSVVEKAYAEIKGTSLSAFHLEGPYAAKDALNNEQYPIYCKLHGDFRYQSIKNLSSDLATQNQDLSECFVNACNRTGLVICGYSGRDKSVMDLLISVLDTPNPFPHGLFWMGIKGAAIPENVSQFIELAKKKGVKAYYIEIETFDAFLILLWRNIPNKMKEIDAKVSKANYIKVSIPLEASGKSSPIIRLNTLPIMELPSSCLELKCKTSKEWKEVKDIERRANNSFLLTKADNLYAWGSKEKIREAIGSDLIEIKEIDISSNIKDLKNNLYLKAQIEKAVCLALAKNKALIYRPTKDRHFLIIDKKNEMHEDFKQLASLLTRLIGNVEGAYTKIDEYFQKSEQVTWSECIQIAVEEKNGAFWLVLNPDVWIWPKRARQDVVKFLDQRKGNRYNNLFDPLLTAWLGILFKDFPKGEQIELSSFEQGSSAENPTFKLMTRTGFSRKVSNV